MLIYFKPPQHFMAKFLCSCTLLSMLFSATGLAQQPFVPGVTYFGQKNYTEYHAGNSALIFTAPHGGKMSPSAIPDRTCSTPVLVSDANTADLAMRIDSACMIVFGCHPHIIICNLSRSKVDCNRILPDGTCGDPEATLAWNDFHRFVDTAVQTVLAQYGKGFYIDLHGHGHTKQRLEMGYLIHGSELRMSDAVLNAAADTLHFSMHTLWNQNKASLTLSDLIRGPNALGTQLAIKGYPAVSSQQDPAPLSSDSYFDGGYNTNRYSSANGGTIDGLQIEHNYTGVRDSYANRAVYADTLVSVLKTFLEAYYFNPATLSGCQLATGFGYAPPVPELSLFPNPAVAELRVEFPTVQNNLMCRLYDLEGRALGIWSTQNTNHLLIPLGAFPGGIYAVHVEGDAGHYMRKLILLPK
jgi:hypothetical protein